MGDKTYPITTSYVLESVDLELPVLRNESELNGRPEASLNKYSKSAVRKGVANAQNKASVSLRYIMKELCIYHSIDSLTNSGYINIEDQNNLISTFPIVGWERIHIKFKVNSNEKEVKKTNAKTAVKEKAANNSSKTETVTANASGNTAQSSSSTSSSSSSSSKEYDTYDRYFYVYSIDNFKEVSNGVKFYTIRFTSLASLLDSNMRLEIRFENKTAQDILRTISSMKGFCRKDIKYTGNIEKESDFDFPMVSESEKISYCSTGTSLPIRMHEVSVTQKHDIICPSWRPLDIIKRIADNTCSEKSYNESDCGYADCVFYQQIDGFYEFSSYYKICNSTDVKEVKYMPWMSDGNSTIPYTDTKYSIRNYAMDTLYDKFHESRHGITGNITSVIDFALGRTFKYIGYYNSNNIPDSEVAKKKVSPSYVDVEEIISNSEISTTQDVNINYHANALYKLDGEKGNNNVLMGMKQSPEAKVNVILTGTDETTFAAIGMNRGTSGSNSSAMSVNETAELQKNKKLFATGSACANLMRMNRVVFELNPCVGLKIGDKIKIAMKQTQMNGAKDNTYTQNAFINGIWWIGDIKYVLTIDEMKIYITAYKNNMMLF